MSERKTKSQRPEGGWPGEVKVPCVRCGYPRRVTTQKSKTGQTRSGLCRDCSSGMTPAERAEWMK